MEHNPKHSVSKKQSESTSNTLLARVKLGDGLAWQELVKIYGPSIGKWIRSFGVAESDLGEVFQDVCVRIARNIEDFERGHTFSFRSWLKRVTINLVNDHRKRQKRSPRSAGGSANLEQMALVPFDDNDLDGDSDNSPQTEVSALVQRVLELIRPEFRQQTWNSYQLTVIEELDATEAGNRLGMTAAAVRKNKQRVLARLREALQEAGIGG